MKPACWLPIPGFEGRYAVSDRGEVMSMNYRKTQLPGILVAPLCNKYPSVQLAVDGITKRFLVHRLVMLAFAGKREPGMHINHIDGNKKNNSLTNLEYCTGSENRKHCFRIGLQSSKGERHSRAKLTDEKVMEIRKLVASGLTHEATAKMIGVARGTVSGVIAKRAWAHVPDQVLQ